MHLVVVLAKSQDFDGLEWNVTAFAPSPFAIVVGVEKESCFRAVEVLISCPYKMDDGKVRNFLSWEEFLEGSIVWMKEIKPFSNRCKPLSFDGSFEDVKGYHA